MIRLFQTHNIRKQQELEGMWDFKALGKDDGIPTEYTHKLPVPSCWEQHHDFLRYRGKGAYCKLISVDSECNLRFDFKGVSHTADVYLDGKHVGKHYNAYTPFSVAVPDVSRGTHELVVLADNSFHEESSLHIPNEYYSYGGITRPAAMEIIPDCFIERVEFTSEYDSEWKGTIRVFVRNLAGQPRKLKVKVSLAQETVDLGDASVKEGTDCVFECCHTFKDIMPWDTASPTLYFLEANLYADEASTPCDDLIERVGFRTVRVSGRKLLVNGKPIRLKGFNRHEEYAIVGSAIPFQLMVKDLELMREMGGNMVRTSHYPNDELFLDLCDEMGIFVWEEHHVRSYEIEKMLHKYFMEQISECTREMVQYHYNHPGIIIWGLLNECASDIEDGRNIYARMYELVRSMDTSRPVTSASHKMLKDISLEFADILSFNIYSGWYNNNDVTEHYNRVTEWLKSKGMDDRPIIISEFGAEGIYGFRTPTRQKWSEERQMDIIDNSLKVYMDREEIVGTIIWQFCDNTVCDEGNFFYKRGRNINNKGIVDEYRRPKLVFDTVKKYYNSGGR